MTNYSEDYTRETILQAYDWQIASSIKRLDDLIARREEIANLPDSRFKELSRV